MKYVLILFLFGCVAVPKEHVYKPIDPIIQEAAFSILKNKCNVCHKSDNPSKIFTIDNMNGFAKKINRQVFFWKRMPKGDKIKLSKKEKETIKNWINNLK